MIYSRFTLKGVIRIFDLHAAMWETFREWAPRIECAYTPAYVLDSIRPPREPRPWYWGGDNTLYERAPYGNEWIINNFFLYRYSQPLHGPPFSDLPSWIDIAEAQRACIRDLF